MHTLYTAKFVLHSHYHACKCCKLLACRHMMQAGMHYIYALHVPQYIHPACLAMTTTCANHAAGYMHVVLDMPSKLSHAMPALCSASEDNLNIVKHGHEHYMMHANKPATAGVPQGPSSQPFPQRSSNKGNTAAAYRRSYLYSVRCINVKAQ